MFSFDSFFHWNKYGVYSCKSFIWIIAMFTNKKKKNFKLLKNYSQSRTAHLSHVQHTLGELSCAYSRFMCQGYKELGTPLNPRGLSN